MQQEADSDNHTEHNVGSRIGVTNTFIESTLLLSLETKDIFVSYHHVYAS